ncbi:arogenate dehydrogenase 2, chloroplastic isoform X2 [Elaeis guineensis]|uniref:arogenate dehydrogenase 2, chloroplastic isoform X2 n=1 Tax=Elaeis guineensis var. tenera TaxID=51953 RepID=UPI003C6D5938
MASSSSTPLPNGPLKIAIIGFGPFAQFLAQTFLKQGHILAATSRSDYSLLCSQLGITFYRDMDDLMEAGIQVILLCTSILSSGDVIRSIPIDRLRMPLLFVDVLSVKEYPRELLLRVLPEEADVLCTHPMFGPESGKEGWNGLPLVYEKVRIRDHALCDNYLGVFQAEGCRMVEMSCQEHDEMAAKSQFLAHTLGRYVALFAPLDHSDMCLDCRSYSLAGYWQRWESSPHQWTQKASKHFFNCWRSWILPSNL